MINSGFLVKLLPKHKSKGCAGWVDFNSNQFICCTAREDFLEIFIHEYCHFLQTKDKRFVDICNDNSSAFWAWLSGTETNTEELDNAVAKVIELEHDCDSRVLKLIKKHKLSIDPNLYAAKANTYHTSYLLIREIRKWPSENKKSIYSPENAALFPNKLNTLEETLNFEFTEEQRKALLSCF